MGTLLFIMALFSTTPDNANYLYYHKVTAQRGDGAITLLKRYDLDEPTCNLNRFFELNQLDPNDHLIEGKKYVIPVMVYRYNGKSIRSTIGDFDYQKALRIQHYNETILERRLRKKSYTASRILWVPYHELHCDKSRSIAVSRKTLDIPLLGRNHSTVEIRSDKLAGKVFYIMAGHGGPDPGAVGKKQNKLLCEDEYAYDVALRLYKMLWEHGAQAYMIIEDKNDGIRDEAILPCDKDERCGGKTIPMNQLQRLQQRVSQVNQLYIKHQKAGVKDQTCLSIHVDSRSKNHRQDVFFCHYAGSKSSRSLARKMQDTFATKYKQHRAGRNYQGSVESRNFYVLKKTLPKAILVELANIQNQHDHQRILLSSNRQALAKWMLESLMD